MINAAQPVQQGVDGLVNKCSGTKTLSTRMTLFCFERVKDISPLSSEAASLGRADEAGPSGRTSNQQRRDQADQAVSADLPQSPARSPPPPLPTLSEEGSERPLSHGLKNGEGDCIGRSFPVASHQLVKLPRNILNLKEFEVHLRYLCLLRRLDGFLSEARGRLTSYSLLNMPAVTAYGP